MPVPRNARYGRLDTQESQQGLTQTIGVVTLKTHTLTPTRRTHPMTTPNSLAPTDSPTARDDLNARPHAIAPPTLDTSEGWLGMGVEEGRGSDAVCA